MLEVKRMLDTVNDGTKVLVIPGNHDCYSIRAFSCVDDNGVILNGVSYERFKEIFSEYGYKNAYSYDKSSLSYIYPLSDDKWILMLDTNLSEHNEEAASNITGGFLDDETLLWLEEHLKYANENGIEVISATHHNLLVHNALFERNYTLSNASKCLELFKKYQIKINFSGHLHIQSIKNNDFIYDISGGGLLDYGHRYGILEIYDNCYYYESKKVEVDTDFNFEKYSFDNFYQEYYDKSIKANSIYYEGYHEEATDLLSKINTYYFDGDYKKIHKLIKKNEDLINDIKDDTRDYEESYVKTIIEVENENQYVILIRK